MCLELDRPATAKYARRTTPIKVYKSYSLVGSTLVNRYQPGRPVISPTGIVRSDRKSKKILKVERSGPYTFIEKGIHVFLGPEYGHSFSGNYITLEGTADPKDLIGVAVTVNGGKPYVAAFTKIKLNPEYVAKYPKNVAKKAR